MFVDPGDGATPLIAASSNGGVGVVSLLLSRGANVTEATDDGTTPFYIACQEGNAAAAALLLDHGADIQARVSSALDSSK